MKNLFLVLVLSLFLVVPTITFGQTWVTTNQATVSWEAVTSLSDGTVIPATNTIKYVVYLSNATTDVDKTKPSEVGTVIDTTFVITLIDEGKYFVGLKTLRFADDGTLANESIIGWTDDPAIVKDGETFGIRYFLAPNPVTNVRHGN